MYIIMYSAETANKEKTKNELRRLLNTSERGFCWCSKKPFCILSPFHKVCEMNTEWRVVSAIYYMSSIQQFNGFRLNFVGSPD
jgi:hypothetical protein